MAKLGRNEKCSCGSGKKYKKCCLNKPDFPMPMLPPVVPAPEMTEQQVQTARKRMDRRALAVILAMSSLGADR